VLPGGVPGVIPAKAVVIGGGVSGWNATQIAVGMGFEVTLLDRDINKLREADRIFGTKVKAVMSNSFELEKAVLDADLVIGAVLIPGAKAPKLVTNELVSRMKPGSVLVDIAIDQGGCFEDSRPTTHAEPTFNVHESVFYCVANMPGAVPNTSTYALTNATLPYIVSLANNGWVEALRRDAALAKGPQHPRREGRLQGGRRGPRPGAPRAELAHRLTHRLTVNGCRQPHTSGRTLRDEVRPDVCPRAPDRRSSRLERNPLTVSHTRETCRWMAVDP
jgi:alanine dehydrogenase